jgi:hypothetical protein
MDRSKTFYCTSKFPWPREIISSKFIHNLGTRPQKGSPALHYSTEVENKWNYPSTASPSHTPSRNAQGNFTFTFTVSNHKFKILNKLNVYRYNIGL